VYWMRQRELGAPGQMQHVQHAKGVQAVIESLLPGDVSRSSQHQFLLAARQLALHLEERAN